MEDFDVAGVVKIRTPRGRSDWKWGDLVSIAQQMVRNMGVQRWTDVTGDQLREIIDRTRRLNGGYGM